MTPFQSLVGIVAAAASFSVVAHDTLGRDWCLDPEVEPQIVGEFSFNRHDLLNLSRNELIVPAEGEDKCGMVDRSQWHSAMHVSANFCEGIVRSDPTLSGNSGGLIAPVYEFSVENVRAIVLAPSSYLDSHHHSEYNFSEGLKGVCVYCPPSPKP